VFDLDRKNTDYAGEKEIMDGAGAYLICQLGQHRCLAAARCAVDDEGRLGAFEDIAFELK